MSALPIYIFFLWLFLLFRREIASPLVTFWAIQNSWKKFFWSLFFVPPQSVCFFLHRFDCIRLRISASFFNVLTPINLSLRKTITARTNISTSFLYASFSSLIYFLGFNLKRVQATKINEEEKNTHWMANNQECDDIESRKKKENRTYIFRHCEMNGETNNINFVHYMNIEIKPFYEFQWFLGCYLLPIINANWNRERPL